MSLHIHAAARRWAAILTATLAIGVVSACSGSEPADVSTEDGSAEQSSAPPTEPESEPESGTSPPEAEIEEAGAAETDICSVLSELLPLMSVLDGGMTDDAARTAESAAAALELLEDTAPPAELDTAWTDLAAFYAAVDAALAEADISAGQATAEVLGGVVPEISAAVDPAFEGAEAIQAYAKAQCGVEADSENTTELCDVVTEADLEQVFGDSVPDLRDGSWGPTAQECIWEAADGTHVSVMLISRSDFEAEFLEPSGEPREFVSELENGELHEGTFGLGRFNTRGSSVYFTAGDWGGTANVRSGEDGEFAVDDPIAIDLAVKVAAAMS